MKQIMERREFLQWAGLYSLIFASGCVKKNSEGRKAIRFIPASVLNAQAESAYREQKKKNKISTDPHKNAIIKRAAHRAIENTNRLYPSQTRGFKWEVTLFDDPKTVNAYAMPGGKVAIYTGILNICQTEAGLSTIIGHEFGHIINSHGNERVSQQLGVSALMAIGSFALAKKSGLDKDVQKAILAATGAGLSLGLLLPYSRKHEHEADRMGIRLMAASGYDPNEAPRLWERMEKKYGTRTPSYLSTHPSNRDRMNTLRSQIPEMMNLYQHAPQRLGLGEKLV